ncbi:apolipoprotein B-100 [Heptranchias perlo]|uniref:apolipoprotein B-100 n=1 Tax=Heptranchias perlo TaxID=212740 RepID=UPI0035595766
MGAIIAHFICMEEHLDEEEQQPQQPTPATAVVQAKMKAGNATSLEEMVHLQHMPLFEHRSSRKLCKDRSEDRKSTHCLKRTNRFKNLKKYFYNYEAETTNGMVGTANSRSGAQISCRVELEVPQYCAHTMRISACTLKEVHSISADGKPNFGLSKNTEEFQQAMSRYDLRFTTTHGHLGVNLYPDENEPTNILNIKRGIISALLVPMESDEDVQTVDIATVYGNCTSEVTVNNRAGNAATRITIGRDLTACNRFTPITDYSSPLALVTGMHIPMSSLLGSTQSCSYSLDAKKHVTEAICNEKHILLPRSHKDQYGAVSHVKQTLKLDGVDISNIRYFASVESIMKKELTLEHADNRAKSEDPALSALQNLVRLSEDGQNQQRANLFQKFVVELRRMEKHTLETALPKLVKMEIPRSITFQALLQCGTPECFGAILKMLQSEPVPPLVSDAVTYAIGLMASPSENRVQDILNLAKFRQTRGTFYALSHTVRKFYDEKKTIVPELKAVVDYLMSIIGSDCSGDEEKIYLTLKALGNMGQAMENANPEIMTTLSKCVKSPNASPSVQQAAIQAFRQMTLTDEVRSTLLDVYTDKYSSVLRRLGAYLIVMKDPASNNLRRILRNLAKFENNQVKSFVSTHMVNILKSEDPMVQELKKKLTDALNESQPEPMNFRKFSRNYKMYKKINIPRIQDPLDVGLQSNIIFEPNTYVPRAVMLETTLNVFGQSMDLFEVGLDGNGFEPSLEAIFGPKGFFPNSAMKALYWVDGKVPEKVSQVLFNWFGISRDDEGPKEVLMKELTHNFQNMLKEIKKQTPEAEAFLRIFGNELGYIKGSDFKLVGEIMSKSFQLFRSLPAQLMPALRKGLSGDLFAHYIFMDSQFNLPTGAGLPLKLSMSGTITPGAKAGIKFEGKKVEGLIKPAVAIEFVTQMGVSVPNFARNGIQINYNLYHESGIEARISKNNGQIKFSIPAPKGPTKLLSVSNRLSLIHSTKTEEIPSIMENRQEWKSCKPLFTGLSICSSATYSNASSIDHAPSYPLTGETRFVVELQPTGDVKEYSASVTFQSQKNKEDLEHSLKFAVQVEGTENTEATAEIKYNTNKHVFTGDVQIPKFDVEFGMKLGVEDKSAPERPSYVVRFDITNKNEPEVTLTGRASYNVEQKDLLLQGLFSVPQLDVKTIVTTQIQSLSDGLFTEFNVEAFIPHSKASYQTNFRYDAKKAQVAWNSEVTSDIKTINEKITNMEMPDMSEYLKSLNKIIDNFLTRKAAQADVTLGHIISNSMVASNRWLKQAVVNVSYADTLLSKLQALQDMDFEQMTLPFTLPEKLFLKSHGSIAGTFSSNKLTITIPIPFGGKMSEEITLFPRTFRVSPMAAQALGINSPSNEYTIPSVNIPLVGEVTSIPSFTIPKKHQLHLPLIGKLEFFTKLNSNYYNWTSTFTSENSPKTDRRQFSAAIDTQATSVLDYLSYHLKGSVLSKEIADGVIIDSVTGSFQHTLLQSFVQLSKKSDHSDGMKVEMNYEWDAFSNLGARASLLSSYQVVHKSSNIEIQGGAKGSFDAASYYCTWNYTMSQTIDLINSEGRGSSILTVNSALFQVINRMNGDYSNGVFIFSSNTDGSYLNLKNLIKVKVTTKKFDLKCDTSGQSSNGDFIHNIKWTNNNKGLKLENKLRGQLFGATLETIDQLNYNEGQLSLLLNTTGKYNEMDATNRLSLTVSAKHVEVEHKWHAGYYDKKFHNTLSGAFNGNVLEVKSDTIFPGVTNQGTLKIDNSGLSTKVTSNVNIHPFSLKHTFSTIINPAEAIMIINIKDQNNNLINLNIEGKADSSGIQATSSCSGTILQTKATNTVNLQLSKEKGLVLYTMTEASYKEMTLNHTNHLTFASWTFNGIFQTDSRLGSNTKYLQKCEVQMQPFRFSVSFDKTFKYQQLNTTHIGQLVLEPFKIDFKGELTGSQMDSHVKHDYTLKYSDWKALLSTNTVGKVQTTNINHKLNLEIVGLSAKFSSDAMCNSKALQFNNRVHSIAIPFVFTFEADTFARGNIDAWGSHSGELNNKFQMRAEPLAIAFHHSYKGASQHRVTEQRFSETLLENKLNVMFNPTEQTSTWKLKSQLNNNAYMQTINAYNNPEKIGMDFASDAEVDFSFLLSSKTLNLLPFKGLTSVDLAEPKKLQISGNLQYDKNRNVHAIDIPFLEHLPLYFESFKDAILSTLEGIQNYLKNIKINQFVQKYKKTLGQVNDFIKEVNLKNKVNDARDEVLKFVTEYQITPQRLQLALIEFHNSTITSLQNVLSYLKEYDKTQLKEAIDNVIKLIVSTLTTIDQQYEITQKIVRIITQMQEILQRFDLNVTQSDIVDWIQNLDAIFQIKAQLQDKLQKLQMQLQNINLQEFADRLKQQITTINFNELIEKLKQSLNTHSEEIKKVIQTIYQGLLFLIEHYEINDKMNSINAKIQQIIVKYELDVLVQKLLDETMQLIRKYRVSDTLQGVITNIKKIDVKSYIDRAVQYINETIEQIRLYDYQKMIDKVNDFLNTVITNLKEFDYNAFVDKTNQQIQEITSAVNAKIKDLELPQKVTAAKEYVQAIQSIIVDYTKQLKQKNLNELIAQLADVLRTIGSSFRNYLGILFEDTLDDLRERISKMNIHDELQRHWQDAVNYCSRIVVYLSDALNYAEEQINIFVEKYSLKEIVDQMKMYLDEGFIVPELDLYLIFVPEFEVSLRAIRKGEFETPSFTVPLTNLRIPSYHVNLKHLNNVTIPTRFDIPSFTVLNLFTVPVVTIDLETIKNFIITTLDNIRNFDITIGEFNTFSNLNFPVMSLPDIKFPEIDFSAFRMPDIRIPKVNLDNFMLNDIQIPKFKFPRIPHNLPVPALGKLTGTFNITCPIYNLRTSAGIHNNTIVQNSPELLAFITAKGKSTVNILSFDLEANAHLSTSEQALLELRENIKLDHAAITVDHKGTLIFTRPLVDGKAETMVKITTEAYNAETRNLITMKIQEGLSTKMETTYVHNLNVPHEQLSSQVSLLNVVQTSAKERSAGLSVTTTGDGKWSFRDYSDVGTYKSELKLNLDAPALILAFSDEINTKYIKMSQNFKSEIYSSFYAKLALNAEANITHIGVCAVNGKADLTLLKVELTGSHNTKLNGWATGTVANSLSFTAEPFSIGTVAKNSAKVKVFFPLTLIGRIEFLNNYELTLNPNEQRYAWQVNSKFNQYRYTHDISASNNEENIIMQLGLNGEANLDFLTMPISIPDISIPYSSFKTPHVNDYSLWEHAGLKSLLRTTRQSFDLSIKTEYKKNKDVHVFSIDMAPVYKRINGYLSASVPIFEQARNKTLNFLKRTQYDRLHANPVISNLPKSLHIPGYTIPVLKAEVSPYKLELPTFSFVTARKITTPTFTLPIINFIMPSYTFVIPSPEFTIIHIPDSLYTLSFPKIKMPRIQNDIKLPAMGNLTYDFSLKSSLVTLSAHAELFNQSDIIARYSASSSSIFTSNFKAEGTTSLARRRGLKLATIISVNHETIHGKHDSTISLTRRNMDASITTEVEIELSKFTLNFKHDLSGNTKSKPNVVSKVSLHSSLLVPLVDTHAQGKVTHSLTLADLTSYFNLETLTNVQIEGTVSSKNKFSGSINNEANIYLNSNNAHSNAKLELSSSADTASGNVWNIAMNENLAVEASTRHIFAIWKHTGDNTLNVPLTFVTQGSQNCNATLELAPWSLTANLHAVINQPSNIWNKADVQHDVTVNIKPESQALKWNNNGHLYSAIFTDEVELLNNRAEIRLNMAGSLQEYAHLLTKVWLPVYEKSLWDILKFDLTTSKNERQYLSASTSIVCTKSENSFFIPLPVQTLANGVKINFPEVTLHVPEWVKNVPDMISNSLLPQIDKVHIPDEIQFPTIVIPLINVVVPSYKFQFSELKLPRVIITPEFSVPYTTLHVPSYTINFTDIAIPSKINILPFEVSLPGLPSVRLPNVSIDSRYFELEKYKIPYLEVTIPEFKIMISQFTLPKSFEIAGQYLQLDNIAKQIADFELPTLTISAMTLEIPALKTSLPLALVLPAFKSFAGNVKVLSPIYNTTWITSVKATSDQDKASTFIAAVDATSSSTLRFLQYELKGSTTISTKADIYSLNGKYTFAHPDLSVNWQQNCIFDHSRTTSQLRVDVTSSTFTDLSIHWQGNNGRISSSVSSPSAGFLGMTIEKKMSNVLYAKLYIHKPSSSEIVILDSKVSLVSPENIQVQFNWRNDVTPDIVNGLKERIPKMIGAVYNCVNKYHTEHLGIEMSEIPSKVKDSMKQNVNKAYTIAITGIKEVDGHLQSAVDDVALNYQQVKQTTKKLYKRAAVTVADLDIEKKVTTLLGIISNLTQEYQSKLKDLIDAAINFLKLNKFQLPGLDGQYTGQELYGMFIKQATQFTESLIQDVDHLVEGNLRDVVKYIEELELKISGTNTTIKGSEILSHLRDFLQKVQTMVLEALGDMHSFDFERHLQSLKENIQTWSQKMVPRYADLKNINFDSVKAKINQLYNDTVNSPYADQLQMHSNSLKEYLSKLIQVSQNMLQVLLEKIQAASLYVKSVREEYFNNSLFGWTVKYNEIDEKLVEMLKRFMEYIKEESPKLIDVSVASADHLKHEASKFINNSVETFNKYFEVLYSEFQENGEEKISEYFKLAKEKLNDGFVDIKKRAVSYKRTIKAKLDVAYVHLNESYVGLIAQGKYAVDLFIENCSKFTEQLLRFLEQISHKLSDGMERYVERHPGQLIINVPHPLEWKSFDDVPHLKEGAMSQLNTTIIKGQRMLQRSTALAWELITESYQKDKKLLKEKRTKNNKSKM